MAVRLRASSEELQNVIRPLLQLVVLDYSYPDFAEGCMLGMRENTGHCTLCDSRPEVRAILIKDKSIMEEIRDINNESVDHFFFDRYGTVRMTHDYIMHEDVCFLSTLIVDCDHRGRGHGNRLLAFAEKKAREWRNTCVTLQVKHDSWMRDWYARRGYHEVAPGYDEGMVLMSKSLSQ